MEEVLLTRARSTRSQFNRAGITPASVHHHRGNQGPKPDAQPHRFSDVILTQSKFRRGGAQVRSKFCCLKKETLLCQFSSRFLCCDKLTCQCHAQIDLFPSVKFGPSPNVCKIFMSCRNDRQSSLFKTATFCGYIFIC